MFNPSIYLFCSNQHVIGHVYPNFCYFNINLIFIIRDFFLNINYFCGSFSSLMLSVNPVLPLMKIINKQYLLGLLSVKFVRWAGCGGPSLVQKLRRDDGKWGSAQKKTKTLSWSSPVNFYFITTKYLDKKSVLIQTGKWHNYFIFLLFSFN